jgi:hypothetical protein
MASVRNLKKDVHYVLGDIIQAIYIHEMTTKGATPETNALLEETFQAFDMLLEEINAKISKIKKYILKAYIIN